MIIGNLVIYALGVTWLAVILGDLGTALIMGAMIFVPGDLVKIAVAILALPGGWALGGDDRANADLALKAKRCTRGQDLRLLDDEIFLSSGVTPAT